MIIPLSSALLDSSNNYKWTNSSAASAAALSYIGHTVCASTEKLVSTREVLVLATFRHQLAILKPLYSYKIKNSKIFIDVYFWYQTSNLLKSIISNKIENCKKTLSWVFFMPPFSVLFWSTSSMAALAVSSFWNLSERELTICRLF